MPGEGRYDQAAGRSTDALAGVAPESLPGLVACLVGLSLDPTESIQRLTDTCGELLAADSALYSRLPDGLLWAWGQHRTPPGVRPANPAEGSVCRAEVLRDAVEPVLIQGLHESDHAVGDPLVAQYALDTLAGVAVRVRGHTVGSLCAVFRERRVLTAGERAVLSVLAAALSVEEERRLAAEEMRRREQYLGCVAGSSADLLHSDDYGVSVPQVLQRLRLVSGAQRCYLLENTVQSDGSVLGICRFESLAKAAEALVPPGESGPVRWSEPGLRDWADTLSSGEAVWGAAQQFPGPRRRALERAGVRCVAALPLHVRGRWHGAIVLDTAEEDRAWTADEIGLLAAVAQAVGAAIERTRAEGQRRALAQLAIELAGEADIQSIVGSVQEVSSRLLGWDAFYFAVRRPDEEEFTTPHFVDTVGGSQRTYPGRTWRLDSTSYHDLQLWAGRPVLVDHETADPETGTERFGDEDKPSQCLMFVPVGTAQRVIGIISAQSYTCRRYDAADLELLQRIAGAVAPALDRAFALEALSRRAREADVLHSLAVALGEAGDEEQMVVHALAAALQLSGLDGGAVYLIDRDSGEFALRRCAGTLRSLARELPTLAADNPQARAAVAARGVLSLRDLAVSHQDTAEWLARAGLHDAFLMPILSPDGLVGVLAVATGVASGRLPQAARDPLCSVATELGTALRRYRAEQGLHRSERRFREMSDLLPEMVYEADTSFRFLYANRSAMRTLGYTLGDIERGLSLSDLLQPTDQERARQFARRVERQFMTAVEEFTIRRKDGSSIPCEISVAAIRGADGEVTGYRGVVRDVSDRVRAQHAERLAVVGQLAAGVAHEFNNILATTQARARAAQISDDPDELREVISTVLAGAGRGAEVCRSLMGFARPVQPKRESIPISRPVDDALAMVARQAELAHITCRHSDGTGGLSVSADSGQLQQVFLNLFINACRAMSGGGLLDVEAAAEEGPGGTMQVVVGVSDTGPGIAREHLPHVFEPFFSTWAEDGEAGGTGLGLSVSSEIIAAHGGTLSVRSTSEQGTVFEVRLPAASSSPWSATPGSPAPSGPPVALDGTVLLAEDDRPLRRSLSVALRHAGCEVIQAASTEEAIAVLQSRPVDVVVSDLMMPGGGGRSVLSAAMGISSPPPVVIITGMDQQSLAPGLIELGAADCLQKPFELDDLVVLVGRLRGR